MTTWDVQLANGDKLAVTAYSVTLGNTGCLCFWVVPDAPYRAEIFDQCLAPGEWRSFKRRSDP